jgi:hypothetical protein
MRNTLLAPVAAISLALGACGEKAPPPDAQKQPESYHALDFAVNQGGRNVPNIDMSGLIGKKFTAVKSYSFDEGEIHHEGNVYSTNPDGVSTASTRLYGTVQIHMAKLVKKYPSIDIPVLDPGEVETGDFTTAKLRFAKYASVLALVNTGEIKAYYQGKGAATPAITFKPERLEGLKQAVSFVAGSGSEFADTGAVATEACQAAVTVESDSENIEDNLAVQELICGSMGFAYQYAYTKAAYEQYVSGVDQIDTSTEMAVGEILKFLILPPAAYQELQNGKAPLSLEGIRAAN